MFNTTNVSVVPRVANSVQIQACSGGIYKSHPLISGHFFKKKFLDILLA